MSALSGIALISGASSELGLALAASLAAAGCQVVGLAHSQAGLARLEEAHVLACQPAAPEEVSDWCEKLAGGPARYFIDLAATRFEELVSSAPPEAIMAWAADDIGLRARLLRAVTRMMLARRQGRCLFLSSVAAARPGVGQGYYAAAKVAGESLFASAGIELARRGITTCSLRVSWLEAGRGRLFLQGREKAAAALLPTRRLVEVKDAVATICFLLSEAARDINATTITLDGGFCATKPQIP